MARELTPRGYVDRDSPPVARAWQLMDLKKPLRTRHMETSFTVTKKIRRGVVREESGMRAGPALDQESVARVVDNNFVSGKVSDQMPVKGGV